MLQPKEISKYFKFNVKTLKTMTLLQYQEGTDSPHLMITDHDATFTIHILPETEPVSDKVIIPLHQTCEHGTNGTFTIYM